MLDDLCPPELRWAYTDRAEWSPSRDRWIVNRTQIRATSTGFEWYDNGRGTGEIAPRFYTGSDREIASEVRTWILRHKKEILSERSSAANRQFEYDREQLAKQETRAAQAQAKYTEMDSRVKKRFRPYPARSGS